MKKILSVILTVVMAFSTCAALTVTAFAAVSPTATTAVAEAPKDLQVNGNSSKDVTYKIESKEPYQITFTYTGSDNLLRWEFPGLEEGVDYSVVSTDGNSITIELLNDVVLSNVIANAITETNEAESTTAAASSATKNAGSVSPDTGASSTFVAGIAAASAGIAVLVLLKKRNDAE